MVFASIFFFSGFPMLIITIFGKAVRADIEAIMAATSKPEEEEKKV